MLVRAARAALASVSFLTVLPVARWTALDADDVRRAAPLFPLVGAGIGAVMGGVAWWLAPRTGPTIAAAVAVAAGAALTGALHLDALADTADGFGGRTREQALRIMRDHQLGAYGVVALVLDLLIKTAAVAGLAAHHSVLGGLVAAGALSRAAPAPLAAAFRHAQPTPGSGGAMAGRTTLAQAAAAVAIGLAAAWLATPRHAVDSALTWLAVVAIVAVILVRRLGGVTGDVLGCACELSETAVLVVLAAVVS
jgi:adenosylcobinamide-GDP ribazoletransferase